MVQIERDTSMTVHQNSEHVRSAKKQSESSGDDRDEMLDIARKTLRVNLWVLALAAAGLSLTFLSLVPVLFG